VVPSRDLPPPDVSEIREPPSLGARLVSWLPTLGCLAIAIGLGFVLSLVGLTRFFGGIALLIALLAATVWAVFTWRRRNAVHRFRRAFGPLGKDLLLVTSDSPHWRAYIEEHWLSRWGDRAVVINWSERSRWDRTRPEIGLFREFSRAREFNPLAIVVPSRGEHVIVVRFWKAFRDHKHGKPQKLLKAEKDLERYLAEAKIVAAG